MYDLPKTGAAPGGGDAHADLEIISADPEFGTGEVKFICTSKAFPGLAETPDD